MTPRKPRQHPRTTHHAHPPIHPLEEEEGEENQQNEIPMPLPPRSNEDLNISVLRRHDPSILSVLSLAPYAVVYIFSSTQRQWEKSGVEGTMFICQLTPGELGEARYCVFVLNRKGLDNFVVLLRDGRDIELTEEFVMIRADRGCVGLGRGDGDGHGNGNGNGNGNDGTDDNADDGIYGLWIYSEPPPNSTSQTRTVNARVIRECALHAGDSLKHARERLEAVHQSDFRAVASATNTTAVPTEDVHTATGVPMGRQLSLQDFMWQQRALDDGWSARPHGFGTNPGEPQPVQMPMPMQVSAPYVPHPPPEPQRDVLGELFRKAGLAYQGGNQRL